jgi:UDP-2-acetamido-3-amino-2,3-dideoxy-glucuronate N-acetyltransferase
MLDADVKLGKDVKVFDPALVNIFGCEIGDGSFIGPFVEITRGVTIGKDCKIESHSFICDSVYIADEVFVGHGAMFTNDLFPKVDRMVRHIETRVERRASIGTNATIICGVRIGVHAIIGAGAVVVKDVPDYAIAAGNPAHVIRQFSNEEEMLEYMTRRQSLQERS